MDRNKRVEDYMKIIICAVLTAIVAAIIAGMVRKKRQGKSMTCNCGGCKSCPMSGSCHKR